MKTNQLSYNRISILFSLTAILLFPFISNAQLKVNSSGNVGIAEASPGAKLSFSQCNVSTLADGITWYSPAPLNYGIYKTAGTWASPNYQQLQLNWITGIILNPGTAYGKSYVDIQGNGLRVTSGNVGIGTTIPQAYLHIDKINGAGIILSNTVSGTTGSPVSRRIRWSNYAGNDVGGIDLWDMNQSVSGTCMVFTIRNDQNALQEALNIDRTGNIGIGTRYPGTYKLYVNGTGFCNGSSFTSDQRFKTNIDTIKNALGIIKQLNPKTFYFDTANVYGMNFPSQRQYGLISQQVETVLPELVTNTKKPADLDSAGNVVYPAITYKALNYNAFIAILMKGIQEQQKTITDLTSKTTKQDSINAALQNQLTQLASTINACCKDGKVNSKSLIETVSQTNVDLNNSQTIVLAQNVPNPFAEQTTINYFLPDNTLVAQILFYDAQGQLIQTVALTQKGKGALNVFAQDLTNGIYTYTLVVDGKIIESKKMVKQ